MSQEAFGPPETRPSTLKAWGRTPVASSDGKSPLPQASASLQASQIQPLSNTLTGVLNRLSFLEVTEREAFSQKEPIL